MIKKFWRISTAVLLTFMLFMAGGSGITAYAFDNGVKGGVVAVVFYLKDAGLYITDGENMKLIQDIGDTQFSSGSGFFIGAVDEDPQYIVTNNHVVEDYVYADEGGTYIVATGQTYNGYPVVIGAVSCELRIYYSDDDYDIAYVDCYGDTDKVDLAVLRIRNATDKRHALQIMLPEEDMVGDTVYTIGYPGNADNYFTGASHYGIEDATVHKGSINKFVVNDGKGVERIAIDATIQHGNSGGPLVTEDGYVIGVNTNVISNSPYTNQIEVDYYALSATELTRFLDKHNIPYEMAGSSDSGSESGVGGIMCLAMACCVVTIIVVVIIIIIVAANSKKKGQSSPKSAGGTAKKAVIRSMATQHNGKTFPVGKAPVTIGRNSAQCVIVFNEGTPGVSGKHCTVSYNSDTGVFTLTDLNSTYGTFLSSGMKLNANAPINLKPGDSFYVGDKANVLRVEVEQ